MLDECEEKLHLSKSLLISLGIQKVYESIKKQLVAKFERGATNCYQTAKSLYYTLPQKTIKKRYCAINFKLSLDFCTLRYYTVVVGYKKKGVEHMTTKGRPTSDPKNKFLKIRVSQKDLDKLNYVAEKLNISKTEVIRKGVNSQYEELKDK